jgi:hypothetical protein
MARHKEKDDEAGGDGLGILATRKRLWRDAEGNIINARRPSYVSDGTKHRALSRSKCKSSFALDSSTSSSQIPISRTGSTPSSTIIVDTSSLSSLNSSGYPSPPSLSLSLSLSKPVSDTIQEQYSYSQSQSWLTLAALPSPITSSPLSTSEQDSPDDASELDAIYEDTWPTTLNGLPEIVNDSPVLGRASEYPASPSWGSQPFQTFMGAQGVFEEGFKSEMIGGGGGGGGEGGGLHGYEWLSGGGGGQWNGMGMGMGMGMQAMSRCREEKLDPLFSSIEGEGARKREWSASASSYLDGGFRRGFGLGTA